MGTHREDIENMGREPLSKLALPNIDLDSWFVMDQLVVC
jgi:hypothetical protein